MPKRILLILAGVVSLATFGRSLESPAGGRQAEYAYQFQTAAYRFQFPSLNAEWSDRWQSTENGLKSRLEADEGYAWVKSLALPISPRQAGPVTSLDAEIDLVYAPLTKRATLFLYIRYGCDLVHWSSWQRLNEVAASPQPGDDHSLCRLRLELPHAALEKYNREWGLAALETPTLKANDAFFARIYDAYERIASDGPPFIGYMQILVELTGNDVEVELKKLRANFTYFGLIHESRKKILNGTQTAGEEKSWDEEPRWRFFPKGLRGEGLIYALEKENILPNSTTRSGETRAITMKLDGDPLAAVERVLSPGVPGKIQLRK